MRTKIKKAFDELENKNYEKALKIVDNIKQDENVVLFIKESCLMALKRYDEALEILELLIEKYPSDDLFLSEKVYCQHFSGDDDGAVNTIEEIIAVSDMNDPGKLSKIAKLFNLVHKYESAIHYCNLAVAIDENHLEAVQELSMSASALHDHDLMSKCADELLKIKNESLIDYVLPVLLKLHSCNYEGAYYIIKQLPDSDGSIIEMMKNALYMTMVKDLDVDLRVNQLIDLSIDEAIKILFDYHYDGIGSGLVKGVVYGVFKNE